jgi:hypothetical protein
MFLGERPAEIPHPLWELLLILLGDRARESVRSEVLVKVAADHLEIMCGPRKKSRTDAFDLLAIDALATYACEIAAKEDDMRSILSDVLNILKVESDSS